MREYVSGAHTNRMSLNEPMNEERMSIHMQACTTSYYNQHNVHVFGVFFRYFSLPLSDTPLLLPTKTNTKPGKLVTILTVKRLVPCY